MKSLSLSSALSKGVANLEVKVKVGEEELSINQITTKGNIILLEVVEQTPVAKVEETPVKKETETKKKK